MGYIQTVQFLQHISPSEVHFTACGMSVGRAKVTQ